MLLFMRFKKRRCRRGFLSRESSNIHSAIYSCRRHHKDRMKYTKMKDIWKASSYKSHITTIVEYFPFVSFSLACEKKVLYAMMIFIFWLMMRQIKTTEKISFRLFFFVEWITTWRWTWLKEIAERVNDLLLKQNQFPHQSVYASNNKQLSSSSIKGWRPKQKQNK